MVTHPQVYALLNQLRSPHALRQLPVADLPRVCQELRQYLIQTVIQQGGHLASGLGVVELTVALHYLYTTPMDQIIWDTGHQAYPHKILTGRFKQLGSIRSFGGLHPFPSPSESPYDVSVVGHSSTSLSTALGLSIAARCLGSQRSIVAVLGDGAMTAGLSFEALNQIGALQPDLLIIFNYNGLSISGNQGALHQAMRAASTQGPLAGAQDPEQPEASADRGKAPLSKAWPLIEGAPDPLGLFSSLGIQRAAPIDGHDLPALLDTIRVLKALPGPKLLPIFSQKGRGYPEAEKEPIKYHAISKQASSSIPTVSSYANQLGEWLCTLAKQDPRVMVITPAMGAGAGLLPFSKQFPNQFFDVGISEQHAVTFAAGLAIGGLRPILSIYSTFLQRAYDQVIHDVALPNLPVIFAIDRAGIVGEDGATHQGAFDISFLQAVPNITLMLPSDPSMLIPMLNLAYQHPGPVAIRYPRHLIPLTDCERITHKAADVLSKPVPFGRAEIMRRGKTVAFLNFGALLQPVLQAAQTLDATVVDMRFINPMDHAVVDSLANQHRYLVTVEENVIAGGAGSLVLQHLHRARRMKPILNIGIPNQFIPHGSQEAIRHRFGLTAPGILQRTRAWLEAQQKNLDR